MPHGDLGLLGRILLGFALAYAFGFERQLRGSPAGDRTFGLVGAASTPHHRILRWLNARTYNDRFQKDHVPDAETEA